MLTAPVARVASAVGPRACTQILRGAPLGARPLGAAFAAVVPRALQGWRRWWNDWGACAPRDLSPPSLPPSARGLASAARKGDGTKQRGWKGRKDVGSEEEEDRDEEQPGDEQEEDDDEEIALQDGIVKDYKDLDKTVASFRFDIVMKAGLDISNKKIEDAFYANRLRLNGQRLIKKSRTVRKGDVLDLLLPALTGGTNTDATASAAGESRAAPAGASRSPVGTSSSGGGDCQGEAVARVVVLRASEERLPSQRYGVRLRRWKQLVLPSAPRGTA